jgi:hypothetical protein
MHLNSPGLTSKNAEKSLALASVLPGKEWVYKEPGIWVAKSRLRKEKREPDKWKREMSQVRILTGRGSAAYFLPEMKTKGKNGQRCADLALDGVVLEMKTVSGTRVTLGWEFKQGYRQGAVLLRGHTELDIGEHSVYIWLSSDLSIGSVKAKIAGKLKNRPDKGTFICYFEKSGVLYNWTYEELRAIIKK